ncbi:hypothetical protein GCM10022243_30100 [Saccharothrix violaceirubra]|uniref:DUF4132 domain-containing protein n=1 Tax=Saccharothrix violaceirubra TaxID=413306 RepID=A0A7W7WWQ5_9PSEU|nr:DUF4132 domain-containing protein [Saccharothrix violaceirubra]MBB4966634.1 hypothetical protein [Saccharothrix violaceirubra]
MRRWESGGRGTVVFREVVRAGTAVTVRSGRGDGRGRASTSEHGSVEAALAHVAELAAGLAAEGFREVPPEELEDVFVPPRRWAALVHPRHDGPVRPKFVLDGGAPAFLHAATEPLSDQAEAVLADPHTEPALAEAVRGHLAGVPDPLGAACVATLVEADRRRERYEGVERIADAWIAEHGLVFAARATVDTGLVDLPWRMGPGGASPRELRFRPPATRYHDLPRHVPPRMRRAIAAASDEEYAAVVEALGAHRIDPITSLIAAYLVPERDDWVDEVVRRIVEDEPGGSDPTMVLCSLNRGDQLRDLVGRSEFAWRLRDAEVLYTVALAVGTGAAEPLLTVVEGDFNNAEFTKRVFDVIAAQPADEAFDVLVSRIDDRYGQAALLEAVRRFPRRAVRRLAAAAPSSEPARALLHAHLREFPELARVDPANAEADRVPDVPVEELPAVLVTPPWTLPRKAGKPAVVTGLVSTGRKAVRWLPGENAEWTTAHRADRRGSPDWMTVVRRFLSGDLRDYEKRVAFLEGPAFALRGMLADWRPTDPWGADTWGRALVAKYGYDALPMALHLARLNPAGAGHLLLPYADHDVAHLMADWLVRLRTAGRTASTWLRRHAEEAARFLLPTALGKPGAARRAAESALVLVPEEARRAAKEHGAQAVAALETLLGTDPLDAVPVKIPVPGPWAAPGLLPQILLRDKLRALPVPSAQHVITMLAFSRPDDEYAGIGVVRDLCDPTSLADFAWAAFERWQAAGSPPKDNWALTALGTFGTDDTARALAPLIRSWPGEGAHAKAVAGLDVLAAMGSDVALARLNGIALRSKFRKLKELAEAKIDEIAGLQGFTTDELADRLVPDLDLADPATTRVDYGPRHFTIGFDERLRPHLTTPNGTHRKDLPKPTASDDPTLAATERKRFTALKKDLRTTAAEQLPRLERAMTTTREWTTEEFTTLLVDHPLLWHVVRRLVWRTTEGTTFHLADDRTPHTITDTPYALAENTKVGIAHPLTVPGPDLAAWTALFKAQRKLPQPFRQLDRPVHHFTPEDKSRRTLPRFEGRSAPVGAVLGLTKENWQRGRPQDGGLECWITRPLPTGGALVATLEPGIIVGLVEEHPTQTLAHIWISRHQEGTWNPEGTRTLAELDDITLSEIAAELTYLTTATTTP